MRATRGHRGRQRPRSMSTAEVMCVYQKPNMNPNQKRPKLVMCKPGSAVTFPDAVLLPSVPPGEQGENEEGRGYVLVDEDTNDSSITMEDSKEVKAVRRRAVRKRKRKQTEGEDEEDGVEVEIDRRLDQSLESKSKQHNLTTVNVRNILHEVITNEHVVAMMKAAINETEAVPPFEPKMTRSKFKEVVEKGVVIPAWNISPIKKTCEINKPPQFVDILLAEEDSSDEEYCPDEEEDDETAEDTFQESDMESTASSPRGSRMNRLEEDSCSPWQNSRTRSRRLRLGSSSMGPPPPPKALPTKAVTDSTFLEKLHAVEEELAVCMEPYQPLSESEDEAGLMAYRTRSKRPLRDVPLGRLEAELRAPDITPDMYDSSFTPEDKEWTDWLRGLMSSEMDNEEECDDEDDPEYNFLADIDEPDLEDYRDDKAVRITKKEVNELMEELFETLKEDLAGQEVDDEGHEEEEETHTFQTQTHQQQHDKGSGGNVQQEGVFTELRTVKQQLALIRKRQHTHMLCTEPYTLTLDQQQKSRLQQQLQQHVQLLTQIHLLSSPVAKLHSEAETTRQFLVELDVLAQRGELLTPPAHPGTRSIFRASNLQGALQLLEELRLTPISYQPQHHPPDARGQMRCFPVMPAELAWLFATRPVFLYPELLPCANLDPALYCPRRTSAFTAAEDCLLVLGLRNMEGSCDPTKLVSQFLLRKTLVQVRRRILQCCRPGFPDNIVKAFRYQRVLWPMPVACSCVDPTDSRAPVEREERAMPLWLVRSLPVIYPTIKHYNSSPDSAPEAPPSCKGARPRHSHLTFLRSACNTYSFPPGTRYPPRVPKHLEFRRIGFILLQQPLPPPLPDSPSLSDKQGDAFFPPSPPTPSQEACRPPQVILPQLHVTRTNPSTADVTREQIRSHYQTLTSLRRRRYKKYPTYPQVEVGNDIVRTSEERNDHEEEESDVLLVLSETSSSAAGSVSQNNYLSDPVEVGSERSSDGSKASVLQLQALCNQRKVLSEANKDGVGENGDGVGEQRESEDGDGDGVGEQRESKDGDGEERESEDGDGEERESEDGDGEQREPEDGPGRESEDVAFAQDYLHRVCDAVQVSPGLSGQLLQVLDQFSAAGRLEAPELLYDRLSCLLQPWPQLLQDFAAFLTREQAARCGLLLEQQLFERSRRFLRRLGQSLGEGTYLYQQVVFVLQGSSTLVPEDMEKISTLLRNHPDLQEEFWEIFQNLQAHVSETSSVSTEIISVPQNPLTEVNWKYKIGRDQKEDKEEKNKRLTVKNTTMTSGGEKLIWTRDADRAILTACQQRGACRKTFRLVSAQLGNKTTQQVSLRFRDLMNLFHSTAKNSTSCSSEGQPINRKEPAPD